MGRSYILISMPYTRSNALTPFLFSHAISFLLRFGMMGTLRLRISRRSLWYCWGGSWLWCWWEWQKEIMLQQKNVRLCIHSASFDLWSRNLYLYPIDVACWFIRSTSTTNMPLLGSPPLIHNPFQYLYYVASSAFTELPTLNLFLFSAMFNHEYKCFFIALDVTKLIYS